MEGPLAVDTGFLRIASLQSSRDSRGRHNEAVVRTPCLAVLHVILSLLLLPSAHPLLSLSLSLFLLYLSTTGSFKFHVKRGNRDGVRRMGRVKDKMGLGFGCDPIRFFCHPLPPHPLPSFASSLQKREKELFSTTPSHQAMLRIEKTCNFKGFLDGEDGNDSECSSSCQSRWTIYLGQSQKSFDTLLPLQTEASVQGEKGEEEEEEEDDDEEEEEDLSMLSDASSGPPNAPENADNCCSTGNFLPVAAVNKRGSKRRRVEEEEKEGQSSILDDTASSTLLSISKASNNRSYSSKRLLMEEDMEHSCGFSATHFEESNIQQQCLDYLHTSSALNPAPVCRHEAEKKLL